MASDEDDNCNMSKIYIFLKYAHNIWSIVILCCVSIKKVFEKEFLENESWGEEKSRVGKEEEEGVKNVSLMSPPNLDLAIIQIF